MNSNLTQNSALHPTLIDSHCHLQYDYLPKTVDDLLHEAKAAGIEALVTIGTDIPSIEEVQKFSAKYENVFHTVGVHPHDAISLTSENFPLLEAATKNPKCRAIGEIGLDYHYDHSPREIQQARLEEQLDLALRVNLPIVIHSREGEEDLFEALKKYSAKVRTDSTPGIIHCFSGTLEFGKKCLDIGFHISFSGILTFKKADEVRSAARAFPLDRLLVETDSPYLAPMPHRGKKCEPSMVRLTAEKLAEVKEVSLDEVARVTTLNAKKIFRIP